MIKSLLGNDRFDSIETRLRFSRGLSAAARLAPPTIRISIFPRDTRQPGKLVTALLLARVIFFTGREEKRGRKEKRIQRMRMFRVPRARRHAHAKLATGYPTSTSAAEPHPSRRPTGGPLSRTIRRN